MPKCAITDDELLAYASTFHTLDELLTDAKINQASRGYNLAGIMYKRGLEFYKRCTCHLVRRAQSTRLNHAPYKLKAKWRQYTDDEIIAYTCQFSTVNSMIAAGGHGYKMAAKLRGESFWQKCIAHMPHCAPNDHPHVVYQASFENGAVYIGYTHDIKYRMWKHLQPGGVIHDYSVKTGLTPTWQTLEDAIPGRAKAALREKYWIAERHQQGCLMLNQNGGGAGGGSAKIAYTDEYLVQKSMAHRYRSQWAAENRREYAEAHRRGLFGTKITHFPIKAPQPEESTKRAAIAIAKTKAERWAKVQVERQRLAEQLTDSVKLQHDLKIGLLRKIYALDKVDEVKRIMAANSRCTALYKIKALVSEHQAKVTTP